MSTETKIDYAVWRKSRDGSWSLFGPTWVFSLGPVRVRKSDGTFEHRRWVRKSKPFDVSGEPYCYATPEASRMCETCGGWHNRNEVQGLYRGGNMGTGAFWRQGEETCDCGGHLGESQD